MPETFILYRFFFEWLDEQPNGLGTTHWRNAWKNCKSNLSEDEWQRLLDYIHLNTFTEDENAKFTGEYEQELLNFYTNYRKDIVTPGTELYELKQQYDKHPTIELRRKK